MAAREFQAGQGIAITSSAGTIDGSADCVMMQPLPKLLMARCIKKSPTLVGLFEFKSDAKVAYLVSQTLVVFMPLSASDLVL